MAAYERGQYLEAIKLWKLASADGEAEAGYRIGMLYVKGEGVRQEHTRCCRLVRAGGPARRRRSEFQLGLIFLHGEKPLLGPYRH